MRTFFASVFFVLAWCLSGLAAGCMRAGKKLMPVAILFAIVACQERGPIRVEVPVMKFVPIDSELTEETAAPSLPPGALTNEQLCVDYVSAWRSALATCNIDKAEIRNLQPPKKDSP